MAVFLIYLIIFLVPLLVIPNLSLRFEPPKVLITEFLIDILVVYCIFSGQFLLKRVSKLFAALIGGLFLLSLVHLIFDPTTQNLFGNIFRLQGTILFWHFLLLALIAQNFDFRLKEKYIYLTSFLGVCFTAFVFGSNSAGRLIGSLGEPNALGAVIILIFPFVILSFKNIFLRMATFILALGIINFAESKSALAALLIEIIFLSLLKITKGKYYVSLGICLVILVLSFGLPIAERNYFLNTNTDPYNFRYEDRAQIWNAAFLAGFENPIFGSGIESIQNQIHETAVKKNFNFQYQIVDSSHNIFLDFWVWGGTAGLVLLITLVVLSILNMIRKKMHTELTVFLGLLTVLSFNPLTVTILAAFWFLIGRSFTKIENS